MNTKSIVSKLALAAVITSFSLTAGAAGTNFSFVKARAAGSCGYTTVQAQAAGSPGHVHEKKI